MMNIDILPHFILQRINEVVMVNNYNNYNIYHYLSQLKKFKKMIRNSISVDGTLLTKLNLIMSVISIFITWLSL